MHRREALRRTALLLGYGLSAATISAVMAGCQNTQSGHAGNIWRPKFLNPEDMLVVSVLADLLLPRTDTPGAKDVGADRFVDDALLHFCPEPQQTRFLEGLQRVNPYCEERFKNKLLLCRDTEKRETMQWLEAQLEDYLNEPVPTRNAHLTKPFYPYFKELVLTGYFTSELIGEDVLNYDPIPTRYDGCIPASEIGKAWSL